MASGIQVAGVDLDTLLVPRGGLSPIPLVGIEVNGVDISQRYAPVSAGSPYGTTNIITQASGRSPTDIGQLFAGSGTSPATITLNAASFSPASGDFAYGFGSFGGSVSPTTYKTFSIVQLNTLVDTVASTYGDTFQLSAASNPGSTLFSTITVGTKVRTSSSATYSYASGLATWSWSGSPYTNGLFQAAITYTVAIS